MKILVFTPTRRPGGIDMAVGNLEKQIDVELSDVLWLVWDELFVDRVDLMLDIGKEKPWNTMHVVPSWEPNHFRNLAKSYNFALDKAREWEADLFVSMQDYVWIPEDGLAKIAHLADVSGGLIACPCSKSSDPPVEAVFDLNDPLTIFENPYSSMPTQIVWRDVRVEMMRDQGNSGWMVCGPDWWETKWGAMAEDVIADHEFVFDETYDEGVAYENVDFAIRASQAGYPITFDESNHAIELPHKDYWPEEETRDLKRLNTDMHHHKHVNFYPPMPVQ